MLSWLQLLQAQTGHQPHTEPGLGAKLPLTTANNGAFIQLLDIQDVCSSVGSVLLPCAQPSSVLLAS